MSRKKLLIIVGSSLVIAVILFLIINNFVGRDKKKEEPTPTIDTNETIIVDYDTYQQLRSEVHETETFAILIMDTTDEPSQTFKEEVVSSFKNRKAKVYEIDTDKLDEVALSGVITDVTKIFGYSKPTLMTPTLLVSKQGKIVYKQEGLIYSPDIISNLDKNKIE